MKTAAFQFPVYCTINAVTMEKGIVLLAVESEFSVTILSRNAAEDSIFLHSSS